MENSGLTPEQTQQLLSILYDIAKQLVLITYYFVDGAQKWHATMEFLYSAKAAIVGGVGVLIGYLLGRR